MSMPVKSVASNPTLQWYECKVTLNKGGVDKVYHCNFLCASDADAQARSASMAHAEGAKFVGSVVMLNPKYNSSPGASAPVGKVASVVVQVAKPIVKALTAKESRAIRAFVPVSIHIEPALYVQGEEAT